MRLQLMTFPQPWVNPFLYTSYAYIAQYRRVIHNMLEKKLHPLEKWEGAARGDLFPPLPQICVHVVLFFAHGISAST